MDGQPRSKSGSRIAYLIGSGLLALYCLYVVSIGPALYLATRHPDVERAFGRIYAPLRWVNNTPLREPMKVYALWWLDLAGEKFVWNKVGGGRLLSEWEERASAEPALELELTPR
jgi:hypothetical protein